MATKLKPLPIGIQTFADIIEGNYTYIDKTQDIYGLVKEPKGVYFLSRPRRFGKSLLVSTLEALFQNRRELFNGLWIDSSSYQWQEYPVVRISMPAVDASMTIDDLNIALQERLMEIANEYKIKLEYARASIMLRGLIVKLEETYNQKVVILIDEYDKPILDNILDTPKAESVRGFLRTFYSELKENDSKLRFIFLTGVSKFSKVSIFSGLNNLEDISMRNEFTSLCGYTQEELQSNFKEYIDLYEEFDSGYSFKNREELLETIREWYNGYRFTKSEIRVYNPFSTLLLFKNKQFDNFWFETGTPKFLVDLIKEKNYNLRELTNKSVTELNLSNFSIEQPPILTTLFQTGYITIVQHLSDQISSSQYKLDYPNREVKNSFANYLLDYSLQSEPSVDYMKNILKAISANDIDLCMNTFKSFFAAIPYSIQEKKSSHIKENYYQSLMYVAFELIGLRPRAEDLTNIGRADMVVETNSAIYIFEMKVDKSPDSALAQIHEKKYHEKYLHLAKPIKLIGVEFSSKERNITEFKVEDYVV
jgi:hypothetical protein